MTRSFRKEKTQTHTHKQTYRHTTTHSWVSFSSLLTCNGRNQLKCEKYFKQKYEINSDENYDEAEKNKKMKNKRKQTIKKTTF